MLDFIKNSFPLLNDVLKIIIEFKEYGIIAGSILVFVVSFKIFKESIRKFLSKNGIKLGRFLMNISFFAIKRNVENKNDVFELLSEVKYFGDSIDEGWDSRYDEIKKSYGS